MSEKRKLHEKDERIKKLEDDMIVIKTQLIKQQKQLEEVRKKPKLLWNELFKEHKLPDGEFHSPDNDTPARIIYFDRDLDEYGNRYKESETYYRKGVLHRENKPAIIRYGLDMLNRSHHIGSEHYYINGKLHNDNGPAEIHYYNEDSNKTSKTWCQHGKKHRIGEPAVISYHAYPISRNKLGWYKTESWFQNDKLHREDNKPALIKSDEIGDDWVITKQEWWENGIKKKET